MTPESWNCKSHNREVARQRPSKDTTTEELQEVVFGIWSVLRLYIQRTHGTSESLRQECELLEVRGWN